MTEPCERFPPLPPVPPRPLLGAGASIGPVRIVCGAVAAITCGVVAAKPPALPDWLAPAPEAGSSVDAYGAPIAVAAPGGALVFGAGVLALALARWWRR